ncbi:hypothetical protein MMIC_P1986 [Mariprofundus micogutta]|uniref:Uncharacterized protein n=2 Tax=Mariprofundus micogutta TaxID=1921010 RepID=A0A1L8CQ41_9PROT|nr:hypothetical protein MMIC_P1986 [Mariprofundus micogutta]
MDTRHSHQQARLQLPGATESDSFRMRMIAQLYQIECYRRDQWQKSGRLLSHNQAAAEWIACYAANFPQTVAGNS